MWDLDVILLADSREVKEGMTNRVRGLSARSSVSRRSCVRNEVVSAMASRQPDLVFWPVYVCFPLTEWKQEQAEAYALQAGSFAKRVVLVNNLDTPGIEEPALGGAFDIQNGQIQASLPWAQEGCLTLEIPE